MRPRPRARRRQRNTAPGGGRAAWRAGYQTRIGNVRRFPVAGSIRVGSARNPDRTPIAHGPVGAGSVSRAPATDAPSSGAEAEPAAGVASAAPAPAASQHAQTNTATNHRAWLPGLTVRYTIAASLSDATARGGTPRRYAVSAHRASRKPAAPHADGRRADHLRELAARAGRPGCERTGAPGRPRRPRRAHGRGGRDGRHQPD